MKVNEGEKIATISIVDRFDEDAEDAEALDSNQEENAAEATEEYLGRKR